jgi:putative ABC transport system permease protein
MNEWTADLLLDLRFAFRHFARRPAFTAVAALTLALGIGAATAVFSIVDAVLLRPLPYKDPGRLAAIWVTSTREQRLAKIFATHADYDEFRRRATTLESLGAATWATSLGRVLTGHGPARSVLTVPATVSFFATLAVPAAFGRTFRAEDETRACSLLLAHDFWTSTLGANPSIVGGNLTLDDKPCTVIGVMPANFSFYPRQAQAWVLLGPDYQPGQDHMLVGIFARLKPGVTLAQAQTELRSLYRAIHPDRQSQDFQPVVYDLHGEFTFLAGRTLRTTLILVFGAVLLLLLIACLNVANLLLAGLSDRRRELAVRAALGSGRGRLIRQVLAEGLMLSICGAALGIAFAAAAMRYFRAVNPIELSVGADVSINLPVLAFSIALSFATTLVFALLPALRASQVDLTQHLKTGARGSIHGRRPLTAAVIATQMAFSFLMLVAAGLLIASALRMASAPLGFLPDRLFAARFSLPRSHYSTNPQRSQAFDRLLAALERLPADSTVALASRLPPEAGGNLTIDVAGHPVAPGAESHDVGADAVSPAFFDCLQIPVRRGRPFDARDREASDPVVIVNDALAAKYFPDRDPLGQQIRLTGGAWLTIVGIAGNLKHTELMNEMSWVESPNLYRPLAQDPRSSVEIAVRARANPGAVVHAIQTQLAAFDPAVPVADIETLTSRFNRTLAYPRFRAVLFAFFALASLTLAAVGLHGVLSQLVARRTPEFGLRRAVGAQTLDLLWLVARQGGTPVILGLAAGIALTSACDRLLANLLYGIQPADPSAFLVVGSLLLAVAIIAIARPAARAARIDPMIALRDE